MKIYLNPILISPTYLEVTKFNEARKTMSNQEAAFKTSTGNWCQKYGYDEKVEFTPITNVYQVDFYKNKEIKNSQY